MKYRIAYDDEAMTFCEPAGSDFEYPCLAEAIIARETWANETGRKIIIVRKNFDSWAKN